MLCAIMNIEKQQTLQLHSRVQLKMDLQPTGFLAQEKGNFGEIELLNRNAKIERVFRNTNNLTPFL